MGLYCESPADLRRDLGWRVRRGSWYSVRGKSGRSLMYYVLMVVHVLVCLFLIVVVLLQSGKAADLAGAFGGMGSQTAFGPRGAATVLSKATTIAAALFMITSMSLSVLATRQGGGAATVLDAVKTAKPAEQKAPAQPAVPQMEIIPEGTDPSKAVKIPLPTPQDVQKSGQKGGATTTIQLPVGGGTGQAGQAPAQKK